MLALFKLRSGIFCSCFCFDVNYFQFNLLSICMSLSSLIEDIAQGINLSNAWIDDLQSAVNELPVQGMNNSFIEYSCNKTWRNMGTRDRNPIKAHLLGYCSNLPLSTGPLTWGCLTSFLTFIELKSEIQFESKICILQIFQNTLILYVALKAVYKLGHCGHFKSIFKSL